MNTPPARDLLELGAIGLLMYKEWLFCTKIHPREHELWSKYHDSLKLQLTKCWSFIENCAKNHLGLKKPNARRNDAG